MIRAPAPAAERTGAAVEAAGQILLDAVRRRAASRSSALPMLILVGSHVNEPMRRSFSVTHLAQDCTLCEASDSLSLSLSLNPSFKQVFSSAAAAAATAAAASVLLSLSTSTLCSLRVYY